MKFVIENISTGAARCGRLTKSEQVSLKTPGFLHYTKAAAVPFLSREVFNYLQHKGNSFGYSLSVDTTFHMLRAVQASSSASEDDNGSSCSDIASFASLPNGPETTLTCFSVKNAGDLSPSGHHEQDVLPVWTRFGKRTLSAADYMEFVEAFRPDMFVALCDGDTNADSSRKRALKSTDRTERFFDECLAKWEASAVLKDSMVLAAIEGGFFQRTREETVKHFQQYSSKIDGYLLDGFHNNGETAALLAADEAFNALVSGCVNSLPADKLRIAFGAYAPATLLRLVAAGVDLFDNSYAYLATRNACALTFAVDDDVNVSVTENEKIAVDRLRRPYDLDLGEVKYKVDFTPLLDGCTCLACTKHTRAYVHHLVKTNELLASILLMIHNVHHYSLLFERIHRSVADGTLQQLIELVDRQLARDPSRLELKLRETPSPSAAKPAKTRRHSNGESAQIVPVVTV